MGKEPVETIQNICEQRLLVPKWLIVRSARTGTSWIEHVVRGGTSCLNLTPATVRRFALQLAGPELSRRGLTVLDDAICPMIVDWAWPRLKAGYFSKLTKSASLLSSVSRTIQELRLHGITPDTLKADREQADPADHSVIPDGKAADLRVLLEAWSDYLTQYSIADQAVVFSLAREALDKGDFPPNGLVLLPTDAVFHGLERQLIESVPDHQRVTIAPPFETTVEAENSSAIGNAVCPRAHVSFARAIGEANEVREVFRRTVGEQLPLDEIEILHTDAATYVPLAFDAASLIETVDTDGLPITFAEGIPVSMSRPIRALRSWIRWTESDFAQPLLVELFAAGLLDCGEFSSSAMAKLLRPLGIRTGAGQYVPKIDEQIAATRTEIDSAEDDDPDALEQRISRKERKLKQLRMLKKKVAAILDMATDLASDDSQLALAAVTTFLTKATRSGDAFDRISVSAFLQQLADRQQWVGTLALDISVTDTVDMLIQQVRVLEGGPRPGSVHVSSLQNGGQSGRRHTFVVGMDDRRFPGALLQDPILLDHERRSLKEGFPDSSTKSHQKLQEVRNTLTQLEGKVTFLWSCQSARDDTEMFATSLVLDVFRHATGHLDADIESLNCAAGAPVSFSTSQREKAITPGEHWLWQLTEPGFARDDQTEFVATSFPHLDRGAAAMRDRLQGFGSWSGHVPTASEHIRPFAEDGVVYSASALEKLGACPLSFFFQRRLGLYPLEEPSDDLDCWLDARQFGTLCHELFRRFMAGLSDQGKRPVYADHYSELLELLRELIEEYTLSIPPPNESAKRRDAGRLVVIARTFLRAEEENCQHLRPMYFEAALGMEQKGPGPGTELDMPLPLSIPLGHGQTIRARGQIDRIDEIDRLLFSICDYKTGSAYGYDPVSPFRQGRRTQNVLYVKMVEQALRQKVDPKSRVAQFEYFFPGTKASGLRPVWPAEDLASGGQVLARLASMDADGVYPPTDNSDDCRYCEFQKVCGNYRQLTAGCRSWLKNTSLEVLSDFRELRNE